MSLQSKIKQGLFSVTGSILFLLKGSKEHGFTFEGLGTCITCCSTTHCIMVRVAKVLTESATLPNSSQPLQEGQEVPWPANLVALYRTTTAQNKTSDGNNSKGKLHVLCKVRLQYNNCKYI